MKCRQFALAVQEHLGVDCDLIQLSVCVSAVSIGNNPVAIFCNCVNTVCLLNTCILFDSQSNTTNFLDEISS